jgi:solute carrier family 25 folate transporter 32
MVAAAQAGILTLVMTNPIWVVKTRLCLQYSDMDRTRLPESKRYLGMMDALNKIYYNEGIRGLYKVCIVSLSCCQVNLSYIMRLTTLYVL